MAASNSRRSTRVDDTVWRELEELVELAPLHNANNLRGITAVRAVLGPGVPQVAVFDTAFHHSLPETAHVYAIPYQYYRRYHVRRYGFHGTSHRYIAYRYRQITGKTREETKIITLHLGNGASACAIVAGQSVDTSMGFTPLEGLVMGTRSGDLDPAIVEFISEKEGMSSRDVDSMLNKQSGLLGISGLTANMRELLAEEAETGDRRARLAVDLFCYRVKKYLGHISPRSTAPMPSSLPAASERTRRRFERVSARVSSGLASVWTTRKTRQSSAAKGESMRRPRASTCGSFRPTKNC